MKSEESSNQLTQEEIRNLKAQGVKFWSDLSESEQTQKRAERNRILAEKESLEEGVPDYFKGRFSLKGVAFGEPLESTSFSLKKGSRILLWDDNKKSRVSLVIVSDEVIDFGEEKVLEFVLPSPLSLEESPKIGEQFFVGGVKVVIGEVEIMEVLGRWKNW